MSISEKEVGQQSQEKFEFYVISLVFTLLAISIQTAKFGNSGVADFMELLGWLAFLVSGVFGLWRLEYLPVARYRMGHQQELERDFLESKKALMEGKSYIHVANQDRNQPLEERLGNIDQSLEKLEPIINKLQKSTLVKYKIHKSFFVFGLISIVISRAYLPAKGIICAIT